MSRFSIHPSLDESSAVQELVGQYLTHEGYVETARSFSDDVQKDRQSLSRGEQAVKTMDTSDDVNAINRQSKFRSLHLQGSNLTTNRDPICYPRRRH